MPTPFDTAPPFEQTPFAGGSAPAPMPAPAPAAPAASPMIPNFAQAPAQMKTGWGDVAALLPALLGGIKDPIVAGGALAGYQRGQDIKRARFETAQQTQERRANEQADFYSRALQEADQFDDPVDFQHWKDAIAPMAKLHGVDVQAIPFNNSKATAKAQKDARDTIATLRSQHGDVIDDPAWQAQYSVNGKPVSAIYQVAKLPTAVDKSGKGAPLYKKPDLFNSAPGDVVFDRNNMAGGPVTMVPAKPAAPGSIEEQMVAAQKAGDTKTYDRLKKVHEEFAAAGRKGEPDPNGPKIPGDPTKTGDAYLQTLPPEMQQLVKHIADYKADVAKVTSLRGGEREQIAAMVMQYDPSFDMPQYASRAKLRTDFTSGKGAQNIRSLNTAVGHLATLKEKADALGNRSSPLWNSVANRAESAVGDPRVVAFNTAATAVEGELASLFKGTGAATDAEIKQWRASLDSSQSPAQQTAALETAIELMHSRLSALDAQYNQGMGKPRDFNILTPASRTILQKMGVNVDAFDPEQTTATAGGGAAPKTIRYDMNGKAIP